MSKTKEKSGLMENIVKAFEKHPAKVKIKTSIKNFNGFWAQEVL